MAQSAGSLRFTEAGVYAVWDSEAKVWAVTESNVPGLNGEAETLEALATLLRQRAPELLELNGVLSTREHPRSLPLRLHADRTDIIAIAQ